MQLTVTPRGPISFANALLKCSTGALLPAYAEYVAAVTATCVVTRLMMRPLSAISL
jgi:hypothetical protein